MVIRKHLVLFLVISLFSVPALADYETSGTVELQDSQSLPYTITHSTLGEDDQTINLSTLYHRFTDAKELYTVQVQNAPYATGPNVMLSYSSDAYSDTRSFTSTVNGVFYGSGIASIINNADVPIFKLTFTNVDSTYANSLTGYEYIDLVYDQTLLENLTYTTIRKSGISLNNVRPTAFTREETPTGISMGSYIVAYNTVYIHDYVYSYSASNNLFSLDVYKNGFTSQLYVKNASNDLYANDSSYTDIDLSIFEEYNDGVYLDTKFDFDSGTYVNITIHAPFGDDYDFEYNITTELDEYSPGDTVNVTYTTDQKGTIQVVKTVSDDIYHSIGFVSGATDATWHFYIAENEPYGFYDIHLLDSSNTILDTVRYSLLPTTSSLDILQSSVDLHETFVIFAQTVNESILSIEDPDGVEVWNESIGALMYDYIYYTPTIKQGIYTAYLYDDATLNDTVMVYLADPPIIDDPLDPETNGSIVVEDVLDPDESMTEYYNEKFRDFAPTIWGFFMLMCLLFLMSILTSFNSGGKR